MQELILVANPGSSSRKYALYAADLQECAQIVFEHNAEGKVVGQIHVNGSSQPIATDISDITEASHALHGILSDNNLLSENEKIAQIGLRVVAPGSFFLEDHIIDDEVIEKLSMLKNRAPLHIAATLDEIRALRKAFPDTVMVGVSDSAFHATKPPYAWNYGINIHDADRLDVKRFGYHGISVAASIDTLWRNGKLPPKVIVCHLGSGASVTAVFHGRSIDTSMGYTPLEGVIMATRSGDISPGAARTLQKELHLDDEKIDHYLNHEGGLLGIGGTNDIRTLIEREANGDHFAHLALTTYLHTIHKAIGAMITTLNGVDLIVFTGTVGERSAYVRKRIAAHLAFVDFVLDGKMNDACTSPEKLTIISQGARSKPMIVIPTNEAREIAKHVIRTKNSVQ